MSVSLHDEATRERVEALQWTVCQQLPAKGLTAIVEWGSWGRWERDILRKRAREMLTRWAGTIEVPTPEELRLFDTFDPPGERTAP